MASFQAKTGWKRLKKRENKNYRFVSFRSCPTDNRKFQKNSKNIQTYHYRFISEQNSLEKVKKERK